MEESVLGWEELELEVVRDAKNQMITVCFIENVDDMGVHTGDSFCTVPMLTIDSKLQKRLQEYSYRIVEAIKVIGRTNIQFAHDPKKGRDWILEKYTPSGDHVVVKCARWAFEKFRDAKDILGTQMRAVGEVMSIGKTYKEALQKAIRSLEIGRYGLGFAKDFNKRSLEELMELLAEPSSERQFIMYEALRKGESVEILYKKTHIKPWFLEQMRELVELEEEILKYRGKELPDELLVRAKKDGFSDRYLSQILGVKEKEIRNRRKSLGIIQGWEPVPVSGVENAAYYFSTYNAPYRVECTSRPKVMVLGGGPNRIGQGIEFETTAVSMQHLPFAKRVTSR